MARKKIQLETMDIKSKKKKTFLIIGFTIFLAIILITALFLTITKIQKEKVFKRKNMNVDTNLTVFQQPEFKENWAIAIENRIEKQNKQIKEIQQQFEKNQMKIFKEIKDIVKNSIENNKRQSEKMRMELQQTLSKFKKDIKKQIDKQNEKIASLELLIETIQQKGGVSGGQEQDIIIGEGLLPEEKPIANQQEAEKNTKIQQNQSDKKDKEKTDTAKDKGNKEEKKNIETPEDIAKKIMAEVEGAEAKKQKGHTINHKRKKKKRKLSIVNVDTSFNQKIVETQVEIDQESKKEEKEEPKTADVSIGLTQAYMITGVHAPVFQEGSEEPLPVLFEAKGDVIMANEYRGNLSKCFLIGSAKGNMNSQTANIRLEKISCLLADGKYRIEGSIRGWVIDGKSGMPGIHGELLHKNGAWLARTFLAGFLETFSEALTTNNVQAISFGGGGGTTTGLGGGTSNTSNAEAVKNNLAAASGSGLATVFKKIGDYYLKMAEQIFPVIEVRGGQMVDIMLLGGGSLQVVKNNPLDLDYLEKRIKEEEMKKRNKDNDGASQNAFTKMIAKVNSDQKNQQDEEKKLKNNNTIDKNRGGDAQPLSPQEIDQIIIPE